MKAPSKSEVTEKLRALVDGSANREEVSRWAQKWIVAEMPPQMDRIVWDAITLLCAADLISLDRPYLYDVDDFRRQLEKLS